MFSLDYRVYPSSCDESGKLKLFNVMQMMQDCSELWMTTEPSYDAFFRSEGRAQLLAYRQLDIIREPSYGEPIRVTTSVYDSNPMFGYRNTIITDRNSRPLYVSWAMGAFVDRATGKLAKVPDDVLSTITLDRKFDMEYTERRIVLPKGEFQTFGMYSVRRDDIDYNHHVNNAHYVRLALEVLPEGFPFDRVRIEYKVPSRMGDEIEPRLLVEGDKAYVVLCTGGRIGTIFEFGRRSH